ncbi:hypothetical protein [Stenotrophomonas sp. SORGH_AS_0282]|uniref:hypothetical protein n=1 Tax=Stenotrophomonas sp. SORGH_AS_0282 TaxID=3041763 RepID=UPI002789D65B|nr:hypothetical protein [Stenotrophomonas sp. SORGH_AS_0282]MDQ1062371.1 hypothetical protein [Stenotrophomonas sp. SORGH_AS_0282]MDQ1189272.1 hypothetical protein [Stenotrophomonas sp. SORGH_AS_0282]
MSYPANAFIRCACEEAPDGALIFVRGWWTLAGQTITPHQSNPKTIILAGDDVGAVYGRFSDRGLCTAPGVKVELRISQPEDITTDGSRPTRAALVIPDEGGPQIWGHIPGAEGYRAGFGLDGISVPQADGSPFYYQRYEVWLTRDGKALSDKPLFTVG